MTTKKQDPIVVEVGSDALAVKLTRDEIEQRAKQAAERAKDAQEWRNKENSFKQNAKDSKETADSCTKECERLLHQVRSGEEIRQVEVEVTYDEVRDMLVRCRIDTGEVISERKAEEADRDRINMKRQRTLDLDGARKNKVAEAAAELLKKTPGVDRVELRIGKP